MKLRKKKKMTEKAVAKHIQQHKGDISTWSRHSTPAKEKKQETAVVFSVRFSPSELDGIRKQADALGVTVASIIRHAVVEHSAHQTVVFSFSGPANAPTSAFLVSCAAPMAMSMGCNVRSVCGPDYLHNLVIPAQAYLAAYYAAPDDPELFHS